MDESNPCPTLVCTDEQRRSGVLLHSVVAVPRRVHLPEPRHRSDGEQLSGDPAEDGRPGSKASRGAAAADQR